MPDITDLDTIRISELPTTERVDKDNDYLIVSHPTSTTSDGWQSNKVTPSKLLADAGVTYTAGAHIAISQENVISANFESATTTNPGLMSASDKEKLNGIEDSANNYTLPIASTTTLGGVKAGSGVTIDSEGVISATGGGGATYTAGANIQISSENVISATDTTYTDATQSASGLMSAQDKIKLDGVEANANNYTLPAATASTIGGVKQGTNITIAADGTISASGGGASSMATLTDVVLTSLANGQILKYDLTSQKWVNVNESGGASSIDTLTDVVLTSLSDGQILKYDATNQKWINANESGGGSGGDLAPQTVVLLASAWDTTNNTITVAVSGVTTSTNQDIIGLPATSAANIANNKALQACNLMDYGQAAGEITLYAENIPSEDLTIRVIVRGVASGGGGLNTTNMTISTSTYTTEGT